MDQPANLHGTSSGRATGVLRTVAAVSAAYDIALGISLLAFRGAMVDVFAALAPNPPIHADLNGLFALAIGVGYLLPLRDPWRYRAYLWLMGPLLKGAGAVWFAADHLLRHSPPAFLWIGATDGALALLTLWALAVTRSGRTSAA